MTLHIPRFFDARLPRAVPVTPVARWSRCDRTGALVCRWALARPVPSRPSAAAGPLGDALGALLRRHRELRAA